MVLWSAFIIYYQHEWFYDELKDDDGKVIKGPNESNDTINIMRALNGVLSILLTCLVVHSSYIMFYI